MDLLLIRHARAVDLDRHAGGSGHRHHAHEDAHRPLTPRGRRDAVEVGRQLREESVELDAILTSPLVRAVETAELVAVGLGFEGGLEVAPELALGRSAHTLVEEVILPRADLRAIALVGHEPQLGLLLGSLLGRSNYGLAKAAAVRLVFDGLDEPARFKWVVRPGMSKPSRELADVG